MNDVNAAIKMSALSNLRTVMQSVPAVRETGEGQGGLCACGAGVLPSVQEPHRPRPPAACWLRTGSFSSPHRARGATRGLETASEHAFQRASLYFPQMMKTVKAGNEIKKSRSQEITA